MIPAEWPRLILRRWHASDREPFARLNADPRVMRHFPALLSREESDALVDRAEAHFAEHGFGPFAAELRETGQLAGFIGLFIPSFEAHFMPAVEIGWRLDAELWNHGLATEAPVAPGPTASNDTDDDAATTRTTNVSAVES